MKIIPIRVPRALLKKFKIETVLREAKESGASHVIFMDMKNGDSYPVDVKSEDPKVIYDLSAKMNKVMELRWHL